MSTGYALPFIMLVTHSWMFFGRPIELAKSLVEPAGMYPTGVLSPSLSRPSITSLSVPSPPETTTISDPPPYSAAKSLASPLPVVIST